MSKIIREATPIPFSDRMVRTILDGSKTQTRRAVRVGNSYVGGRRIGAVDFDALELAKALVACAPLRSSQHSQPQLLVPSRLDGRTLQCVDPVWCSGQRLWVREAWAVDGDLYEVMHAAQASGGATLNGPFYRADSKTNASELIWRVAVHMPSWVSRLALEITNVRVQRIQGITAEDCLAEGIAVIKPRSRKKAVKKQIRDPRDVFRKHWEKINGAHAWDENSWVWVFEFERVRSRGSR